MIDGALDITGYSASMQCRQRPSDANPTIDWSTDNGLLIVDASRNAVVCNVAEEVVNAIVSDNADHTWRGDLFIRPPGGESAKVCLMEITLIKRYTIWPR